MSGDFSTAAAADLALALRILAEADAGHQHGTDRIEWARGIVERATGDKPSPIQPPTATRRNRRTVESNVEMRNPVDWTGT